MFDAATLQFRKSYDLPTTLQPDGVPWVAVDPAERVVYTSAWTHADALHVLDLEGVPLRQVPLSPASPRATGPRTPTCAAAQVRSR